MKLKNKKYKRGLCKYHVMEPTKIAYKPRTCWVCEYFEYWEKHPQGLLDRIKSIIQS